MNKLFQGEPSSIESVKKKRQKFLFTLLIMFGLVSVTSWGQTVTISGNVYGASDNEPIIGANVVVVGTLLGTVTDFDGDFTLDVPENASISVSYIGYLPQTIKIGAERTFRIALQEDAVGLEDVVVIGYGSQRKSDLTGGIVALDAGKLQMVTSNNLADKLAGQIPGLNITNGSAAPGADQVLRVRGENSLSADNSPLIVLDGIPFNGSLNDIDPDVIENLSVLKDASAAAIYGSRGSNGVILIQTKKGKTGAATVMYKGQVGLQQPERRLDIMKGPEYVKFVQDYNYMKRGYRGDQLDPMKLLNPSERANYQAGNETDWQDVMFRNSLVHSHQISVSGGTEATTYMASISHMNNQGVVENTGMNRTNLTINLSQVFNKWLTIGMGTQATQRETGGIQPYIESGLKQSPYGTLYDQLGEYYDYPMDQTLFYNPMADVKADHDRTIRNLFMNAFADILLPVKGLSFRSQIGYTYQNTFDGKYYGRNTLTGKKVNGSASIKNIHYYDYTWENLLKYNNTFGKHKIDATALFSVQETNRKMSEQKGTSFVNDKGGYNNMELADNKIEVASELDETAMISYMGRVNYSYANKYMLTLTARSDGYSAFGVNNKYAFFPSVAAAWNLSSEDFFRADWVDMLKVRASWGSNGNQAIKPYQTLNRLSLAKFIWGDGSVVNGVYIPAGGIGNPSLKWETTQTFNLGLDMSFFNARLSTNIDFYVANTKDLLMSRTVPAMNGYTSIMDNVGQTRNVGIEIAVNSVNIQTNDFLWTTNVNFSLNRDKIIELRGDGKDDITNKWFIGKPVHVFYDYNVIGVWQEGEEEEAKKMMGDKAVPGWAKLEDIAVDGKKDGKIDASDKKIIGSKLPSFLLSMGNQFSYKDFNLSILLNGVFGQTKELHDYNFDRWMPGYNYLSGMGYWMPDNPTNKMTSPDYTPYDKHSFYKKMNYVQIKNITLGYTFRKNVLSAIGISAMNVNVSVNNLYTFSNVKNALNFDANDFLMRTETGSISYGNMIATYPSTRSYMFGLNLTF